MKTLDEIKVEYLGEGKWKVLEDIQYKVIFEDGYGLEEYHLIVPAGFITDFASIPRGLWNIFPPTGKYLPATILHDWMYFTAWKNKKLADKIFRIFMKELDVAYWKRWIMWAAVSVGGKGNYT